MSENDEHWDRSEAPRTPPPAPPARYRPPRPPSPEAANPDPADAEPSNPEPTDPAEPAAEPPSSSPAAQPPAPGQPPPPPAPQRPADHGQQADVRPAGGPTAVPGPQDGTGGAAAQPNPQAPGGAHEEHREYANAPQVNIAVPGFMKPLKPRLWLTLLASQAMAYAALLLLAVLAVIALSIGALLGAGDEIDAQVTQATGGMDLAPSLFIALITLPFQIAAVWLFGTFQFNLAIPESLSQLFAGGDGMGLTIWAPNLLFVVLAAALAVWVGRIWLRRSSAAALTEVPRLARVVANLVIALVLAGVTVLITWIFSYRETFDLADMAEAEGASEAEIQQMAEFLGIDPADLAVSMNGNAAGVGLFLGTFITYLVIGLVLSVSPRIFRRAMSRAEYYLPSVTHVPRVLVTHALIVLVPALIYVAVMFTIEAGAFGAFSIFFWVWPAAVISLVFLSFGAVTGSGTVAEFGQSTGGAEVAYLWTADFAWWEVTIAILVGLFAIAVASLVWGQRRDARESTLKNLLSWFTLPLVYAVAGLLLVLFGQIRGAFDAFGAVSGDFHLGPTWWTFVILLLIGLVIEVLSRVVAPMVVNRLPAGLRRMTGGAKPTQ